MYRSYRFLAVAVSCVLALLFIPLAHSKSLEENVYLLDSEGPKPEEFEQSALSRYLKEDNGHTVTFEERFRAETGGVDIRFLNVSAQKWQGYTLYNQIYVGVPKGVDPNTKHAVVIVAGGSFRDKYLEPPTDEEQEKFLGKIAKYAPVANRLDSPFIIVRNVPFQRMMLCPETVPKGKTGNGEDDLIACTFKIALETGDYSWPLLLPMTKSVHVAIDVAQQVFRDQWGLDIESFTALGASKRGWTTLLAAATDERITAAVPIVIDMLNLPAHLELQIAAWNSYSRQIADYANHGVLERLTTPEGAKLIQTVDPFRYRKQLDKPMVIVTSTNDEYWPVDAANLYFDQLGRKAHILYLPNQGHGATDYPRLLAASKALHDSVEKQVSLPSIQWDFYERRPGKLSISVSSDIQPVAVSYWTAESKRDRDFRDEEFESRKICDSDSSNRHGPKKTVRSHRKCGSNEVIAVDISKRRCATHYAEMWFEHDGIEKYSLTTTQYVTGGDKCLTTKSMAAL
jgi:PhoPQ-activated pathogenicity-related protein